MKAALAIAGAVGLCGCAVSIDANRADLMPDSVARKVVSDYLGSSWVSTSESTAVTSFVLVTMTS